MDMDDSTSFLVRSGRAGAAPASMERRSLRAVLEEHYAACNHRDWIHPDPLEVVYRYESKRDREVVGLIAACLAYGRVGHILQNLARVLKVLGPSPHECLVRADAPWLTKRLGGFKHRWTTSDELVAFLLGMASVLGRYGSLERCFLEGHRPDAVSTVPGLIEFVRALRGSDASTSLLPAPERGSACKRLHLYLRWMVRRDDVDPGCWRGISASQLIVPLDTHMHRIARALGMTSRKQASLAAAEDATRAFRVLSPEDPVRYDFSLTRLGIRGELDLDGFLRACQGL